MLDLHDKWNETVCELFLKQMEQCVCLADDIKEVNLRLCFGLCWWDTCCIQRQCTTGDNVHLVISINTTQVHLHTQTPVPPHTDPSTSTHRLQHLHTQTLMYVPTDSSFTASSDDHHCTPDMTTVAASPPWTINQHTVTSIPYGHWVGVCR